MSKDTIPKTPNYKEKKSKSIDNQDLQDFVSKILQASVNMQNESKDVLHGAQKIQSQIMGISHLVDAYDNDFLIWQRQFFDDIEKIVDNDFYEKLIVNFTTSLGSPRNFISDYLPQDFEKMFLIIFFKTFNQAENRITRFDIIDVLARLTTYLKIVYRIDVVKSERIIKRIKYH